MTKKTNCLLIVDVQKGFINDATRHLPSLIEAAQADFDLVFATRFVNPDASVFRRYMNWGRFAPESAETELAFAPALHAVVIEKTIYSCVDDGFCRSLRAAGVEEITLCGIDTDICVTKCAVDLFERGIRPIVRADLCGSHAGAAAHKRGIETLKRFIGEGQVVQKF